MGFHHAVFSANILGGTVHRVLSNVEANVAIFVDRGFRGTKKILVPYLGSTHDVLAMELARRLASAPGVEVTVLHVVPRSRNADSSVSGLMDRLFSEPGVSSQVHFKIVQDDSPIDVVVQHAQNADLTIVGVGEEWGLESHLFGFRSERIAQEVESSLLIVRRHKALPVSVTAEKKPALVTVS